MPMNITFELSDKDLKYFKRIIKEVRERSVGIDEAKLIAGVRKLIEEIRGAHAAGFVVQRLEKLERMVKMLEDKEWDMEGKDRSRVADGLVYFAEGEDLIPDRVPGLGYLDDAITIDLDAIGRGATEVTDVVDHTLDHIETIVVRRLF